MLAAVEPVMSDASTLASASRYVERLGLSIVAFFVPARFSSETENVAGARGNTICVNRPLTTESALTIAPGHSESEFAAYATMRSYWRVSLRFSVVHE